jgi:hypothetical protein
VNRRGEHPGGRLWIGFRPHRRRTTANHSVDDEWIEPGSRGVEAMVLPVSRPLRYFDRMQAPGVGTPGDAHSVPWLDQAITLRRRFPRDGFRHGNRSFIHVTTAVDPPDTRSNGPTTEAEFYGALNRLISVAQSGGMDLTGGWEMRGSMADRSWDRTLPGEETKRVRRTHDFSRSNCFPVFGLSSPSPMVEHRRRRRGHGNR